MLAQQSHQASAITTSFFTFAALSHAGGIVPPRSTCKQEAPLAVAVVAGQHGRGNGGEVENMSCEIESTSAVL